MADKYNELIEDHIHRVESRMVTLGISQAEDFYENDVKRRAKRGNASDFRSDIIEYDPNDPVFSTHPNYAGYYRDGYLDFLPVIKLKDSLRGGYDSTIVHEMTHYNQDKNINDSYSSKEHNYLNPDGVSKRDSVILNKAYITDGTETNDAASIKEKHATNRELRYEIYTSLKDRLGRPPTVKEVNKEINSYSDESILNRLGLINGYGLVYKRSANKRTARKVKQALKNVSFNQPLLDKSTVWAKQGVKLLKRKGGRIINVYC